MRPREWEGLQRDLHVKKIAMTGAISETGESFGPNALMTFADQCRVNKQSKCINSGRPSRYCVYIYDGTIGHVRHRAGPRGAFGTRTTNFSPLAFCRFFPSIGRETEKESEN